ncbi:MAG: CRTAC1 family protein [Aureliella sp.]
MKIASTILCVSLQYLLLSSLALSQTQMLFQEVSDGSGIDFVHQDGSSGQRFIVETLSTGMALIDFDGDDLPDIYFLNGAPLPGSELRRQPRNRLFRNNGDWTFTDVTENAGVGDTGYSLGVACADYDQDGDEDIYIANFGDNVFFVNNGDGTFTKATQETGLSCDRFGAGACFADIDRDGDLDLYAANYIKYSFDQHRIRMIGSHQFHPGPHDYPAEYDRLYRNNGDGTFTDISQSAGVLEFASTGMGVLGSDVDRDGDIDFFVANDSRPNFLWINDGHGQFSEEAVIMGVAYDQSGKPNGNMGIEPLDFNSDGWIDLFSTTYQDEMPVLYQNLGGVFEDATRLARIDRSLVAHVNWGIGAQDFDNDGDKDLFIACGHFMDNIQFIDDRTSVQVRNYLLENRDGTFSDVTQQAGPGLAPVASSRGACFEDMDGDGDIDAVIVNFRGRPNLLRNETASSNNWLQLRLGGLEDNRAGVGSLVKVALRSGLEMVAEVHAGRGYQSSYGRDVHFGLADSNVVDFVEVCWPRGSKERFQVEVNRSVLLIQGEGTPAPE